MEEKVKVPPSEGRPRGVGSMSAMAWLQQTEASGQV
jgi:hypothetical protein